MGVIMYKNNRYAGGGSADPSLHFDWSNQTLPQTGDTNTIYCIPTGDTSDPWDFYAWNDTDEEFVKIDFNMTISIDSALSDTSTNPVQNRVVKGAIDAKADNTQTFTEASTRANIASGETFQVILGKIKKFFTDLKAVAFSGSYNDLSDKPTIPAAQVNSDWNASSGVAQILNKPTIPAEQIQSDWNQTTTTAKDYIKNKPTIPAAQVNSDWDASSGVAQILNKPTIPDTSTFMQKGVDRVTAGQLSGSTLGIRATAEGYDITASGLNSHGEGSGTTAEGENSHAEGNWTFATGFASHTEGEGTYATKSYSHAEGYHSTASGTSSHAEGYYSTASGNYSHVEGFYNIASGNYSHVEGYNNVASGNYSHAEGDQTKASSDYQHVEGKYNVEDANGTYAHIIGGGTANNARKNIFTVDWNGDVNAGRSNGLTNDTKLPTGADVISYLNSNYGTVSVGTITKLTTTGTMDATTCYKMGKMVIASGRIHSMTNQLATGAYFNIPDGFRPTRTPVQGIGYMMIDGADVKGNVGLSCGVATNGNVSMGFSNNYNCNQVYFFIIYFRD